VAEEITPKVNDGLKLPAIYKFATEKFSCQRSHTMFLAGSVFNFGKTQKTISGWNR
jgi:hypothetical protein